MIADVYTCTTCECDYTVNPRALATFDFESPDGEQFKINLADCPHCEALQLPSGYNSISFAIKKEFHAKHTIQ